MPDELLKTYADATRYFIVPGGLRDVHVHFRDPGVPEAETRATGAAAAAAGGFTCVTTMPKRLRRGSPLRPPGCELHAQPLGFRVREHRLGRGLVRQLQGV